MFNDPRWQISGRLSALACACCLMGSALGAAVRPASAQEPAARKAPEGGATGATITVPDDPAPKLLEFIAALDQQQLPPPSELEKFRQAVRVNRQAVVAAADKILSQQIDDETLVAALKHKFSALDVLRMLGDEQAAATLAATAKQFASDPRPAVASLARRSVFNSRAQALMDVQDAEARQKAAEELVADFPAAIGDPKTAGAEELMMASTLGDVLSQAAKPETVGAAYRKFADLFAQSDNEQLRVYAEKFRGVARLMELPGKPMEIEGTLLNGQPFAWSDYKGKVVLVDFWATWCGPCIAELPNVKQVYETYHPQGFDVIGISLDDDKQQLQEFVEAQRIPWPILFSHDPQHAGWDNPLAAKYGIMGIPRAILIGRDGNVVSTMARGEELPRLVAEQFADKAPATANN